MWQWNKGKKIKLTYSFHFSTGQLFKKQTNKKPQTHTNKKRKETQEALQLSTQGLLCGKGAEKGSRRSWLD